MRKSPEATKILYPAGERFLYRNFHGGVLVRAFLIPAAKTYQALLRGSRRTRASRVAPVPGGLSVVSIGNLEVGGTGKTPLALHIIERLTADGYHPVYISRGFKSRSEKLPAVTVVLPEPPSSLRQTGGGVRFISRGTPGLHTEIGDEGAMVSRRLPGVPLLFSRQKRKALSAAFDLFSPTHAVLDDAFQSWGVPRDIDVVLLDAEKPFGNGRLFPAGSLREEAAALSRADFIGLNGLVSETDLERCELLLRERTALQKLVFGILPRISFLRPDGSLLDKVENPIASLSSIARPGRFDALLRDAGCDLELSLRFPDHYSYGNTDIERIWDLFAGSRARVMVTTEKDWAKLQDFRLPGWKVIIARLEIGLLGADLLSAIEKPQLLAAARL